MHVCIHELVHVYQEIIKLIQWCVLAANAPSDTKQSFLNEIEMMKTLASGTNMHVVKMIGCVTIQEPLALILEFVPYGNLLDYLRTNRKLVRVCTVHRGHVVYSQPQLVRVCTVHRGHVVYSQPQTGEGVHCT